MELPPSAFETDAASVTTKSSSSGKIVDLLTCDEPEMTSGLSGTSTPAMMGADSCSTYSTSPPPSLLQPLKLTNVPETDLNPWDSVPDQPPRHVTSISVTASNIPSSSISSISSLQTSSADSWLQSLTSSQPQISGHSASGAIFTSLASVSSKLRLQQSQLNQLCSLGQLAAGREQEHPRGPF